MAVSEKKMATNKRYDDDTYKKVMFKLRKVDDADIIAELEQAVNETGSKRTWIRDLHDNRYTRQQIIDTFADFRGVLTKEMVERMLDNIK